MWKRFKEDERGNVSLLVAAGMVGLLGCLALVSDVGMVYFQKQKMYTALDAGALAGIQRILFGEEAAEATTREYVEHNGETANGVSIDTNKMRVDVSGEKNVNLSFARVLGYQHARVKANVTAQAGVTAAGSGLVPIAVPDQDFHFGQMYSLSEDAGDGNSGNYGFLDFPGANGAEGLGELIREGYEGTLRVGDKVYTKTGLNVGKVHPAIDDRINLDADDVTCNNFSTAASGCKRIMYLPVIDSLDVNGQKQVTILGFAAFYLEGMTGKGGQEQILGRFIRTIMPGELGQGHDYGVYSVKLTH